jgi:hypothetical protein
MEYNRPTGRIINFESFADSDRARAADARLKIELDLNKRGVDHEVVLLKAASEEALRRTHRRYFEDPGQIVKSTSTG